MKSHNAFWTLTLFIPLLASLANAQQCPSGVSNPSQLLDGTTWAFQTQAAEFSFVDAPGVAAIGKFSAKQTGPTQGTLTVTETVNNGGSISRDGSGTGQFAVYPNCSGGTLTFKSNGYSVQYEFVFVNNYTELYLSADWVEAVDQTVWGTAKISAPSACPLGASPLSVLNGTTWPFHAETVFYVYPVPSQNGAAVTGIFKPVTTSSTTLGTLTVNETINIGGQITLESLVPGLYQVDPDCSGGQITINRSALPIQYAFVFIDNTFSEMYLLADTSSGSGEPTLLGGHAKKF